jgi:electron transport complex protein RnfB
VSLAAQLLAVLPQTQCTRCGFPDCAGYAHAMADQQAPINQCPPGGEEGIRRLAKLTGQAPVPLNPAFGQEGPRSLVWIDENWCIGCTLCIEACPVDAIIGTHKRMHTVLEEFCTGCELCLPVCPVDCMHLENVSSEMSGWDAWSQPLADQAKERYEKRNLRLSDQAVSQPAVAPEHKQSRVEAALARAKAQRGQ